MTETAHGTATSAPRRYAPVLRGSDVAALVLIVPIFVVLSYRFAFTAVSLFGEPSFMAREILSSGTASLSILASLWLVFVRKRGTAFAAFGFVRTGRGWIALAVLIGAIEVFVTLLVAQLLVQYERSSWAIGGFALDGAAAATQFAVLVLYLGLLAPLAEELVFRGVLFGWLRQRTSFWTAAVVSAAVFAVLHELRVEKIISTGIAGLLYAWMYERSRSLIAPIVAHQVHNTSVFLLALLWLETV